MQPAVVESAPRTFLTVSELAGRLGVGRSTAYALVRDGQVPAIRLRGTIRIPLASLERWLADREQEALNAVRHETSVP
jgi:excisionase family DNA binding protein